MQRPSRVYRQQAMRDACKILDMIRPVNSVCVKLGCSLVVDRTSESANAADSAEYEDDFEPEESDRSSVTSGPDDGECVML